MKRVRGERGVTEEAARIAALADIAGTTNYPAAGGTIPPGCISSEARIERYDADVSPGTTRDIPGMNFASIRKRPPTRFGREGNGTARFKVRPLVPFRSIVHHPSQL